MRIVAWFAILTVEAFSIRSTGIKGDIWSAGSLVAGPNQFFRLLILPFLLTLLYVAALRFRAGPSEASSPPPLSWKAVLWHASFLAAFVFLTRLLMVQGGASRDATILSIAWFAVGVATAASGILAAFGPQTIAGSTRGAALVVVAFAIVSLVGMPLVERSWNHDSNITVRAATALLQHMGFDARSQGKLINISHFAVIITPACSGYEGISLFLIFALGWLVWFRKEYRFPYALLLLPVGAAISWSLNVVRIAAYVLIGHFGHRDIAMNGFHSWAGLLAFTALALGFCTITPSLPGISAPAAKTASRRAEHSDPLFWYLMPFLAVLAASMISKAASGGMEWLYPLRVLAAAAAIWPYRRKYLAMDWGRKPSLMAVACGLGAAIFWLISARGFAADFKPAAYLNAAPLIWRVVWLAFRTIGGVLAAPFVEELAFRGFLMRCIQSPDFASLDSRACNWLAIAISSVVFGLLHGPRFVQGTVAGLLYAFAYKKSGKLADPVLAHASTNLILAAVVAATGDWRYW